MAQLFTYFIATIFGPAGMFGRFRQQPHPGAGFEAMLLMAAVFSGFNLALWHAGHHPTVAGLIDGRDDYYLWQAIYAIPVFIAAWLIFVFAVRFLGGMLGGKGNSRALMGALGLSLAVPLLLMFVVPDIVVYVKYGHAAVARMMRFYAPICALWLVILSTVAVKEVEVISYGRAFIVAALALIIQSAPILMFIR